MKTLTDKAKAINFAFVVFTCLSIFYRFMLIMAVFLTGAMSVAYFAGDAARYGELATADGFILALVFYAVIWEMFRDL